MIGIPVGLMTSNLLEWGFHKYALHGLGKKRDSFFHYHWQHHKTVRKDMYDSDYEKLNLLGRPGPHEKEVLLLVLGSAAITPLFPVAPFFTGTLWYSGWRYYQTHKRCHLDVEWGRANVPWHFDHHEVDADANWCVTRPWSDWLLGTRVKTRKRKALPVAQAA